MVQIIKQRVLTKLGRRIVRPALPRLAVNGTSKIHGHSEKRARVGRVSCGCGIRLDQEIFSRYRGPVKCLSCSAMLGANAERGVLKSIELIGCSLNPHINYTSEGSLIN